MSATGRRLLRSIAEGTETDPLPRSALTALCPEPALEAELAVLLQRDLLESAGASASRSSSCAAGLLSSTPVETEPAPAR